MATTAGDDGDGYESAGVDPMGIFDEDGDGTEEPQQVTPPPPPQPQPQPRQQQQQKKSVEAVPLPSEKKKEAVVITPAPTTTNKKVVQEPKKNAKNSSESVPTMTTSVAPEEKRTGGTAPVSKPKPKPKPKPSAAIQEPTKKATAPKQPKIQEVHDDGEDEGGAGEDADIHSGGGGGSFAAIIGLSSAISRDDIDDGEEAVGLHDGEGVIDTPPAAKQVEAEAEEDEEEENPKKGKSEDKKKKKKESKKKKPEAETKKHKHTHEHKSKSEEKSKQEHKEKEKEQQADAADPTPTPPSQQQKKKSQGHGTKDKNGDSPVTFNDPTPSTEGITRYSSFTVKTGPGTRSVYKVGLNNFVECPPPAVKGMTKADIPSKMMPMIMGQIDAIAHDTSLRGERARIHRAIPVDKLTDLPDWMPVLIEGFPVAIMVNAWCTVTYASNVKNIKPIVVNQSNSEQIVNFNKVTKKDLLLEQQKNKKNPQPQGLSNAARESGMNIKSTAKYWVLMDKYASMSYTYVYEVSDTGKRSRKKSQDPVFKFLDFGSIDSSISVETYLSEEGYTKPVVQACLKDEKGYQRKKRTAQTAASGDNNEEQHGTTKVGHRKKASSTEGSKGKGKQQHHKKKANKEKHAKEGKGEGNEDLMAADDDNTDETKGAEEEEEEEVVAATAAAAEEEEEEEEGSTRHRKQVEPVNNDSGNVVAAATTTTSTSDEHTSMESARGKRRKIDVQAGKKGNAAKQHETADAATEPKKVAALGGGGEEEELSSKKKRPAAVSEEQTLEIRKRVKSARTAILSAVEELKKDGLHRKDPSVMMWTKMASGIAKSAAKIAQK